MKTALILAGAVAKGAFEAGVLEVLTQREITVSAIVSTSAGSLNAALYATGLRFNRPRLAAETLVSLWQDHAGWLDIVQPTWRGLVDHTGLSSTDALEKLLFEGMQRVADEPQGGKSSVRLQMVTTNLSGSACARGGEDATTFEHVVSFSDGDFDTPEGRRRIAHGALASAAFPVLFVPVALPGVGPCIDGGTVNNTPISWALEAGVERVILVTGNPRVIPQGSELGGVALVGKEVDIAVNERLFRDLLQARKVNSKLAALEATLGDLPLDESQRKKVLDVLAWKHLELFEVRPENQLQGNAFSALGKPELRREYIKIGREAAMRDLPQSKPR
jgi:NTE family protein